MSKKHFFHRAILQQCFYEAESRYYRFFNKQQKKLMNHSKEYRIGKRKIQNY